MYTYNLYPHTWQGGGGKGRAAAAAAGIMLRCRWLVRSSVCVLYDPNKWMWTSVKWDGEGCVCVCVSLNGRVCM